MNRSRSDLEAEEAPTRWRGRDYLFLALIVGVYFAMRWPFRHVALIRDEGEYAHLGQRILQGDIPYRDVYNQKTPLVFYVMALIEGALGESIESLRLGTTLYGMVTTAVIFVLGRRLFGLAGGVTAALAACVMTFDQCGVFHQASTESFMLLWIATGVLLWSCAGDCEQPRKRLGFTFLAGAAACLAYQTKQTGAALIAFLVLERIWRALRDDPSGDLSPARRLRAVAVDVALALAGFTAVLAVILAYFASHGALESYVQCTWVNNWQYVGRRHRGFGEALDLGARVVRSVVRWDLGLWIFGAAALAWAALRAGQVRMSGLWILLALTAAAAFYAGQPYVHYYEPLILPLALGNGLAAALILLRMRSVSSTAVRLILVAALFVPYVWPVKNALTYARADARLFALLTQAPPPFEQAEPIGSYLRERTDPNEPFLIVGSEPEIYYHADRPAATRLVITYPLIAPYSYSKALRREFRRALATRPRYVLLMRMQSSLTEWPVHLQEFMDPVLTLLGRDYAVEQSWMAVGLGGRGGMSNAADDIVLYRRRE